ncbi:thioesterase-like superfamily-domain-containing protein [Durotheca rogersii]|uniref:thioesterase-like superfamily-domain-containing protein n=1 Tax=Durotheca rogersii TaxID=419775 RepID=UPI00222069FF|nr:thioesterase-like superfamily-domain-containing protein [Durotheca rogersii]KAI5860895.1 thioesterase-like superfamily-domain-containing protein [Durotheca rogersii]
MHMQSRGQPDTITAHFQYLNQTEAGLAVLIVDEVKIGRGLSTLQVTLYQGAIQPTAPWVSPSSRKAILGLVTNTRISLERGISLATGWTLRSPPSPMDPEKLLRGDDEHWELRTKRFTKDDYVRALENMDLFVPRQKPTGGVLNLWCRLVCGENFTNVSLAYLADAFPYVVESWRPGPGDKQTPFPHDQVFWYPTITLNLDVKKDLSEAEVEWLFVRNTAKSIQNGRLDLDVVILTREGELVATSRHVCLILGAERNLGGQKKPKM